MSLKNFRLESDLEIKYRRKKEKYYLLYILANNMMFKKYLLNEEYQKMLDSRKSDFLEYMRMLMDYPSEIIVKPIDVYAKHSLVTSYTYPKESGTFLTDMYPKTDLDSLLEALDKFYDKLDELNGFDISRLRHQDILYTGDIKISNLDECEYGDYKVDKSMINDLLWRGIFNIDNNEEIIIRNEDILNLYNKLKLEQIDLRDFFQEYIKFIKKEYGRCHYVRHLNPGIITSKKIR